jgi:hypothetical protein
VGLLASGIREQISIRACGSSAGKKFANAHDLMNCAIRERAANPVSLTLVFSAFSMVLFLLLLLHDCEVNWKASFTSPMSSNST